MIILRVALDVPLPKLFDYRSEDATRADIGYRVLVPFGTKHRVGVIVDVAAKSEVADSRLRPVEKILRDVPPLSREWLALAKFCSDYYHRPLGEVVMSALPPRLRTAKAIPGSAVDYVLTPAGREALALVPERHKRLRALLGRLARGRASESELEPLAQSARGLLKRAIESGWVAPIDPPQSGIRFVRAHELTSEQQRAVDVLLGAGMTAFVDRDMRNAATLGGLWDFRAAVGSQAPLAVEPLVAREATTALSIAEFREARARRSRPNRPGARSAGVGD